MPADYDSDPECRWIEQFVKEVAPDIDTAQCGKRLDGDYELWLRLRPGSRAQQVVIAKAEYEDGQGGLWKERIKVALQELNS
jgi:hypothetical protein